MKKKVKAEVINADWEIKKYELRQKCKNFIQESKPIVVEGGKFLMLGIGIGTVYLVKENLL